MKYLCQALRRFFIGLPEDYAIGGTIRQDAPALLVIDKIRNHDLIQHLLMHGGVEDRA